ncbi:hypothetical protein EJ07DRAFT_150692 [Lizonia empirigonia]|nr:hypothetical protein EJ07DRAFT_150692 [Lizonia empirigonia]
MALSSLAAYPKRKPDQPLISHVDLSSYENPNQPMHRQRQRRVPPFPSGSAASKFKGSPICSPSPIVLYPQHRTHPQQPNTKQAQPMFHQNPQLTGLFGSQSLTAQASPDPLQTHSELYTMSPSPACLPAP